MSKTTASQPSTPSTSELSPAQRTGYRQLGLSANDIRARFDWASNQTTAERRPNHPFASSPTLVCI